MGTSRHEPALTGLPNTLARLYDNVRSAKALLMRAGVDTLRMDMSGSSEAMWFSILEEAAKLRRVGDIVRAAQEESPDVLQSLSASLPPPDNAVEERTRTGDETPEGWIVTGYPWYSIKTPEHDKFLVAYQRKWKEYPRLGSIVGYASMMSIAAAVKKAGSTDTEKLVAAFKGLQVDSPLGKFSYRPQDNQSTMGAYVGVTAVNQGRGVMKTFRYVDGASVMPPDAEVKKLRPAD